MSDVSSDDCGSEIGGASPEVPLPLSRREHSKVSRKKLDFEEVSQMLDSHSEDHDKSNVKVSRSGPGRLESSVSERVPGSRLSTIARGFSERGGASSQHKSSGFVLAANLRVPSKTPPALRRHSETTTPHIHPRPLTSLSNPEKGSMTCTSISTDFSLHGRKLPGVVAFQ